MGMGAILGTHYADLTPLGVKTLALLCPPPPPPSLRPSDGAAVQERDGVRLAKSFPSSLPLHPRAGGLTWTTLIRRRTDGRSRFFRVCTHMHIAFYTAVHFFRQLKGGIWEILLNFWGSEKKFRYLSLSTLPYLLTSISNVTGNACECGMLKEGLGDPVHVH